MNEHIITTSIIFSFQCNFFLINDALLLKVTVVNIALPVVALFNPALFYAALFDFLKVVLFHVLLLLLLCCIICCIILIFYYFFFSFLFSLFFFFFFLKSCNNNVALFAILHLRFVKVALFHVILFRYCITI